MIPSFRLFSVILFFIILALPACGPTLKKDYVRQVNSLPEKDLPQAYDRSPGRTLCNQSEHYVPDPENLDHTPHKVIQVNLHFMSAADGKNNFSKEKGIPFAKEFIKGASNYLNDNLKMNLPTGNNTPQLPLRYSYSLTPDPSIPGDQGVYFHRDDELYYMIGKRGKGKNNGSRAVYDKYGVQKGKVLNIFLLEPPVDSLSSPTFRVEARGIAFGDWVKLSSVYQSVQDTVYKKKNGYPYVYGRYNQQRSLNHEIGHCVGLSHSWRKNDGCDDTPVHANCWKMTGKAPCNEEKVSNNVMDYVPVGQAMTPCQIGRSHLTMSNKNRKVRGCLKKTWCKFDKAKTIEITKDTDWKSAKDIEGHLVVMDGARLTLRCRLSLPRGAKIIVYPKAELILDGATLENDCGDKWAGIEVWTFGDKKGKVTYLNSPTINNAANDITVL